MFAHLNWTLEMELPCGIFWEHPTRGILSFFSPLADQHVFYTSTGELTLAIQCSVCSAASETSCSGLLPPCKVSFYY